jgi:hypothetical protein
VCCISRNYCDIFIKVLEAIRNGLNRLPHLSACLIRRAKELTDMRTYTLCRVSPRILFYEKGGTLPVSGPSLARPLPIQQGPPIFYERVFGDKYLFVRTGFRSKNIFLIRNRNLLYNSLKAKRRQFFKLE